MKMESDNQTMDLFKQPVFGTNPHKLVRKQDPDTSHAAAAGVDTKGLEQMVFSAIKSYGSFGCISDQILTQFSHLPYSSVTARYRALLDKGLIEDTGERRSGRSGKPQRVMREKETE
jgi:DNA-binding transcriptional ArsR family regulator